MPTVTKEDREAADKCYAWEVGLDALASAFAAHREAAVMAELARIRGVFKRVADIDVEPTTDGTVVARGPTQIRGNTLHALIAYLFTEDRP